MLILSFPLSVLLIMLATNDCLSSCAGMCVADLFLCVCLIVCAGIVQLVLVMVLCIACCVIVFPVVVMWTLCILL